MCVSMCLYANIVHCSLWDGLFAVCEEEDTESDKTNAVKPIWAQGEIALLFMDVCFDYWLATMDFDRASHVSSFKFKSRRF